MRCVKNRFCNRNERMILSASSISIALCLLTSNMQQANTCKSSTAGHSQHSIENADHGRGDRGRMDMGAEWKWTFGMPIWFCWMQCFEQCTMFILSLWSFCPGLPNHSGYLKEGTFKVTSNLSNSLLCTQVLMSVCFFPTKLICHDQYTEYG